MRIENKRIIFRKDANLTVIEDSHEGIISINEKTNNVIKLGHEKYRLIDLSKDGKIAILNSEEWLVKGNANKTILKTLNIETNQVLFTTEKYLAYRGILDKTGNRLLLEYWNGLCEIDILTGTEFFRKDKAGKPLYNADINYDSNVVFIPTGKKSLLKYRFDDHSLVEIKLDKISSTTWVKLNSIQNRLLVSDKKNSLHCFDLDSLSTPIWSIDFSKFNDNGRIWCFKIHITKSDIGCVQGFMPASNQNAQAGGILWIFDINTGNILKDFDYAKINQKIITDYQDDKVLLDSLDSFSLKGYTLEKTKYSPLIEVY